VAILNGARLDVAEAPISERSGRRWRLALYGIDLKERDGSPITGAQTGWKAILGKNLSMVADDGRPAGRLRD